MMRIIQCEMKAINLYSDTIINLFRNILLFTNLAFLIHILKDSDTGVFFILIK